MTRTGTMEGEVGAQRYERYWRALGDEPLPAALVDLDAFDRNVDRLLAPIRSAGKRMRVATKSIRCLELIDRVVSRGGDAIAGLMTYAAQETAFLAERGHRDLLLAYPTLRDGDLAALVAANRSGCTASVVIDNREHLDALERAGSGAGLALPFVVELDVAYRPVDGVHLGVRRSPLRTPADVLALVDAAAKLGHVRFHGVMAYEAQIAGLTDRSPFGRWMNLPKRLIKLGSRRPVEAARRALVESLKAGGSPPELVNGAGTGNVGWAAQDPSLTEITVGSGFLASHLFGYYRDLALEPAAYFALQVTRRPAPGLVTCHGGGFVASGEAGPDRLPVPALPEGLALLPREGAGEVQTPLIVPPGVTLALGDPVFFRHAKAGELAEHFNEYLLVRGDRIEGRAPTYRGLGRSFLG